jgi:DNA-binding NarL/FixJ family response regulator
MRSITKLAGQLWRVLIVDDHPLFRDGLRELLRKEQGFVVVGDADSEDQAFRAFIESKADLVIVDVSLAAGNGLSLIARIKEHSPEAIVLVVSMYEDKIYAELALAAGASGYVCKHTGSDDVSRALSIVTKGEIYITPGLRGEKGPEFTYENSDQARKEKRLSSRELQIFTMIGNGRSTLEIADELQIAVSTMETYRERLKAKLNLESGSALTRHAVLWVLNCKSPSQPWKQIAESSVLRGR